MNGQVGYYILIVLIYLGVDVIAVWGFNLQYGTTRVVNLGYILSQAAGAYITAVLSIGRPIPGAGEHYILGARLPFPVPDIVGTLSGGVVGVALGLLVLRRLRQEYAAIVTLVIAVGMVSVVSSAQGLFNGDAGVSGVPTPLSGGGSTGNGGYLILLTVTVVAVALAYWVARCIDRSPLSRALRAVRDNELTAESIGIDTFRARLLVMAVGGCFAGLSGALLVRAVGAWSPGSWSIFEVLVVLTAVVIGGPGNLWGSALGAVLVPLVIGQGILFLPAIGGDATVNSNLQLVVTGIVEICALMLVPNGVLRERVKKATAVGGHVAAQRSRGGSGPSDAEKRTDAREEKEDDPGDLLRNEGSGL